MSMSSYIEGSSRSTGHPEYSVLSTFVLLSARGHRGIAADAPRSLLVGRLFANGPDESKSEEVLMAALRFVAVKGGFNALFRS